MGYEQLIKVQLRAGLLSEGMSLVSQRQRVQSFNLGASGWMGNSLEKTSLEPLNTDYRYGDLR